MIMKRAIFFISILFLVNIIDSCKAEKEEIFVAKGYVIGFDPCKKGVPIVPIDTIRGLIIEVSDKNCDTLLTYNLPWVLFDFPGELFESFRVYYYFPEPYQRTYKIKLTYRFAKPEETQAFACVGDIFAPGFERLVKKQIVVLSADVLNK